MLPFMIMWSTAQPQCSNGLCTTNSIDLLMMLGFILQL